MSEFERPVGVSEAVLSLLATEGELHVREAARRLGRSAAAVGRVLRNHEQTGHVQSRWVGRSRVYRAVVAGNAKVRRGGERPYFLWDLDVTWDEFAALLHSPDAATRRWTMERLLGNARWADIWSLVTPEEVRRDLPGLNVRFKEVYEIVVDAAHRR